METNEETTIAQNAPVDEPAVGTTPHTESGATDTGEPEQAAHPAPTETAVPADAPEPEATQEEITDIETRLAEAEQRGYLRGRNERIEALMKEPGIFERQSPAGTPAPDLNPDSSPMILNNPRISIWDR